MLDPVDVETCECLECSAARIEEAEPDTAAMLRSMAGVYPGGPNCTLPENQVEVTVEYL